MPVPADLRAGTTGNREAEASTLIGLGMVHMRLGDHAEARQCLETALRLLADTGPPRGQASAPQALGQVALRQRRTAEACSSGPWRSTSAPATGRA
jgi:Tfp pilus assembly protein PilF